MSQSQSRSRVACLLTGEGCLPALSSAERVALAKGRRMVLLLLAICLMSFADLVITLTYMRSTGMIEVNPIARFMISVGSAEQLIRYKVFTIALSCGVLYLLRRHPRAELGAWICVVVLFALTLHWVRYNSTIVSYTNELSVLAMSPDEVPEWVHLRD